MTIQERIKSKENAIEKLKVKLERINTALATGKNPYYYEEYDRNRCIKDIESAKQDLVALRDKEQLQAEKAASRNVPAITEFLNKWRDMANKYYLAIIDDYYKDYEMVMQLRDKAYSIKNGFCVDTTTEEYRQFELVSNALRRQRSVSKEPYINSYQECVGKYVCVNDYITDATKQEATTKLWKALTSEMERKYDDLISRVNAVVGQIVDASNLRVGVNLFIEGLIIGTRNNCEIETIQAGGYAIQCLHYRVLVKERHK